MDLLGNSPVVAERVRAVRSDMKNALVFAASSWDSVSDQSADWKSSNRILHPPVSWSVSGHMQQR
jgi:hypothetical protein